MDASLAEHVARCDECARSLALRRQAREAWRRARARDDEHLATARERRILGRVSNGRRGRGARPTGVLIVALALLAASAAAMIASRQHTLEQRATSLAEPERVAAPSVVPAAAPPVAVERPVASSTPEQTAQVSAPPEVHRAVAPEAAARAVTQERPADDGEDLWRAAEEAIARGDRTAAEASLRRLLQRRRDSSLSAKAGLRLAELLLARGATLEARERLTPLVFASGGPAARDAVWLYARSFTDARERADAWARFLATDPPQPMRDLASIERASVLLGEGDETAAREVVRRLDGQEVQPVVADALRILRLRLERKGAPATDGAPSVAR
jgi:hypothetical protein